MIKSSTARWQKKKAVVQQTHFHAHVLSMSLLMAAVLEYTGSIIAPTIMHFVWNGAGAVILGGVSLADDYPHLMNMTLSGNDLLSGGACKMEGSVMVLVINILLTAFFCAMKHRKPYSFPNGGFSSLY